MGCVSGEEIYGFRPRKVPFEVISHVDALHLPRTPGVESTEFQHRKHHTIEYRSYHLRSIAYKQTHTLYTIKLFRETITCRYRYTKTHITHHAFINKSQIRPVHHVRPRRRWQHAYVTSKPSHLSGSKKLTHNRPPLDNPHRLEKHQKRPRLATRLPLRLPRQLLRRVEREIRGPQEEARSTTRVLHRRRQQPEAQRQLRQPEFQAQRLVWFAV